MIMYAHALYRSFKVKWKSLIPTHVLFIIIARMIMYARAIYSSFNI